MLLRELREQVLDANLELVRRGVVIFTFGNVSGISRKDGLVAIKPSGVPYDELTAEQIVVTDLDCHAMWLTRVFHRYFVAIDETKAHLEALGLPAERITVSGIPIDPIFA